MSQRIAASYTHEPSASTDKLISDTLRRKQSGGPEAFGRFWRHVGLVASPQGGASTDEEIVHGGMAGELPLLIRMME